MLYQLDSYYFIGTQFVSHELNFRLLLLEGESFSVIAKICVIRKKRQFSTKRKQNF